jgi:tetratricopeptide (TPR) repeat protein
MPAFPPRTLRAAFRLPAILMATVLCSCLAPSPRAARPSAPPSPEPPWESMSALIALGDPAAALDAYERALAAEPGGRAPRALHAKLLMIAGRLEDAREELSLLLAENPADAEALFQLAVLAGLEGDSAGQAGTLSRVVELEPSHAEALAGLGDFALARGDDEEAARLYGRALASDPDNLVALLGTAQAAFRQKDWEGAEAAAGRATAAQPDYPFAYIDRARARRARGDTAGAIGDLGRAISLDPSYPWSYIDRGKLSLAEGRDAEALADFTMAVELAPEIFAGWALRAPLLEAAGRDAEALFDYERVVSLRPDYWYAWPPLGALCFLAGDWQKARSSFLEASRYDEEDFSLPLLAALSAHRGGDPRTAAAIVEEVLPRMPRDGWEWEVARFLLKPAADMNLVARAQKERNRALRARMLFYLAEMSLAAGRQGMAMSLFADIDGAGAPAAIETRLAKRELARMSSSAQTQESQ